VNPIKAVIFDMDGTLLDTLDTIVESIKILAKRFNYDDIEAEKARDLVGRPAEYIISVIFNTRDTALIQEIKSAWIELFLDMIIKEKRARLFPDTINTLNWLKTTGMKIGIGSSLPRILIKACIETFGIVNFIDAYTGGDEVEKGKPEPDIFLKTAERLKVKPSEAVIVGDTLYDIEAGLKGGFITVLVDYYDRHDPEAIDIKPHYYVKGISELKYILTTFNT